MDWILWVFLFVELVQSSDDAIPIVEGDFEKYYEIWYKPNRGTYMICSTYSNPPVYALNYRGTNKGGHLIMTHTPKYLIEYEQHGSMNLLTCDAVPERQDPNDRYVKNWPSDVPLKSFMINGSLLINSTHLMYTNDLLRQNPGDNNPKCCPLKKIETAIPDLTPDMKNKIEECFRMDVSQPVQPYCVLKTDGYGNSIWELVYHNYPVLYHKHDVTIYYKPTNDSGYDVFVYDHVTKINYFVPKNLTTFPSESFVTDEVVVVRIPLVKPYDVFFEHRGTASLPPKPTTTEHPSIHGTAFNLASNFTLVLLLMFVVN
ncbi:hypothetical protein M3Y94_00650700 [Aphelenchoides besseyi]|nr:hypothetical protein M3Y94_00650700 [Aphelenchoides besseyi]